MPTYNLTYRDGTQYEIIFDFAAQELSINRTKAGNVRKFYVTDWGGNLFRKDLKIEIIERIKDSEGDEVRMISDDMKKWKVNDGTYYADLVPYTGGALGTGIKGELKLCLDMLFLRGAGSAPPLDQTRVFAEDGSFIHPVYFELTGVAPNNDPDFNNGSVTATMLQSHTYVDLQVRFRPKDGTWGAWQAITTSVSDTGLTSGTYEAQVQSVGTNLLIKPIEEITI